MNGKRLALGAAVAALVVAVGGGPSNSTGQTQDAPGITYGGKKDQYQAWLRLFPTRRGVAAMQIHWGILPGRCSHGKAYAGTFHGGLEEIHPVQVSRTGRFKTTRVGRYRYRGRRYEETQVVNGTVKDHVATGSISGRVRVVRPDGLVVRCTFGPQSWRLTD